MELGVANAGPTELLRLKQRAHEVAQLHLADEEISQRASTLDSFFSHLAEVRGLLHAHAAFSKIEEACARAFVDFPAHPLFKGALADAAKQKAALNAQYAEEVQQRVDAESDFTKQSAILREALNRFPRQS